MKRIVVSLVLLILPAWLLAQLPNGTKPPRCFFGEVTAATFSPELPDYMAEEPVIVLHEKMEYIPQLLTSSFRVTYRVHVRKLIRSKEGYDAADIAIVYEDDETFGIRKVKAATYVLENGQVKTYRIRKKEMQEEELEKSIKQLKFTFPQVSEGVIIEYEYETEAYNYVLLSPVYFGGEEPTLWSEFTMAAPTFLNYEGFLGGSAQHMIIRDDRSYEQIGTINHRRYYYVYHNIPAFKEESFMTTMNDYVGHVMFQLRSITMGDRTENITSNWQAVARDLYEHPMFGLELRRTGYLKNHLQGILGKPGTVAYAAAIRQKAMSLLAWNGQNGGYLANVRKALDKGTGDAAEVNFLLAGLLKEAGFDVDMVLLSTRGNGKLYPYFPMRQQINYVVVKLNLGAEKYLLMDATTPALPADMLPLRCMNGQGIALDIEEGSALWVDMDNRNAKWTERCTGLFELKGNGQLTGHLLEKHQGYAAVVYREAFVGDGQAFASERYQVEGVNVDVLESQAKKTKQQGTFSTQCKVTVSQNILGDRLYLNPMIYQVAEQNPFKNESRTFPVDLGFLLSKDYRFNLTLPEGYQVEELPTPVSISLPEEGGKFVYNIAQSGRTLQLSVSLKLNQTQYAPNYYTSLREF